MDLDRYAQLRRNLRDAGDGNYVSVNDPMLWKKVLNRHPDDSRALYHVGLSLEDEARKNLKKYHETKLVYFLYRYRKKNRESLNLLKKSWYAGYLPAGGELVRIKGQAQTVRAEKEPGRWIKWAGLFLLLLLCLALGTVISILLFSGRDHILREITEEYRTFIIPYQVIDGRPDFIPDHNYHLETVPVGREPSKEKIANDLLGAVKTMYENDPVSPKKVFAVARGERGQMEVGVAIWPGGNSSILVYLYPRGSTATPGSTSGPGGSYLLWETTTVIRSALHQYAVKNGRLPADLAALTQPFPNNYLTSLPRDPFLLNNSVHPSNNGGGGWVYRAAGPSLDQILKPNLKATGEIDFDPLYIFIDKSTNSLLVLSGATIIRKYSVALGKENKTPEGKLYVAKKMILTGQDTAGSNPYGTRVMELSNPALAIHGTNTPASIGQNVTMGCVRLTDPDMEDLYSIVPLYSPVVISRSPPAGPLNPGVPGQPGKPSGQGPVRPSGELYVKSENPLETVNTAALNWSG